MSNAIGQHWQYVVNLAYRIGRGRFDAEDLAQDVFERWLRAAPRLPPTANQRAWLTVVLRRLAIDRLRHHRVTAELAADCDRIVAIDDDRAPWWLELDPGDVARALDELPAGLRTAFRLQLEGKSYDQIADQLRIAKATVGVRLWRARHQLRQRLSARHGPARRARPEPDRVTDRSGT